MISGLGRSPGEGKGYPLQHSGLENSKDYSSWSCKESDTTEWLSLHFHFLWSCRPFLLLQIQYNIYASFCLFLELPHTYGYPLYVIIFFSYQSVLCYFSYSTSQTNEEEKRGNSHFLNTFQVGFDFPISHCVPISPEQWAAFVTFADALDPCLEYSSFPQTELWLRNELSPSYGITFCECLEP